MRAYDDAALRHLIDEHETISSFGNAVQVKRSTGEERPGMLDPWLLARLEEDRPNATSASVSRR